MGGHKKEQKAEEGKTTQTKSSTDLESTDVGAEEFDKVAGGGVDGSSALPDDIRES